MAHWNRSKPIEHECPTCNGLGTIAPPTHYDSPVECKECNGLGYVLVDPLEREYNPEDDDERFN
jgi:DnaJ-class molecular chaperone